MCVCNFNKNRGFCRKATLQNQFLQNICPKRASLCPLLNSSDTAFNCLHKKLGWKLSFLIRITSVTFYGIN